MLATLTRGVALSLSSGRRWRMTRSMVLNTSRWTRQ
jgi:hypothetical protein